METVLNPEGPSENLPAPRPPDVEQAVSASYQQTARGRIVALPFAVGLMTLGVLLLVAPYVEGLDITAPIAALILIASLVLSNLFRFFIGGRRERGQLFLAVLTLSFGGAIAVISLGGLEAYTWWPLTLLGTALALTITYLADIQRDMRLLGLAGLTLLAGSVALLVTLEVLPASLMDALADFWPLLIALLGVTLIPLALRRSA